MNKIKLYDVHGSSALGNFETLMSPDKLWFYWDNKRFKKYDRGDIVFWLNRVTRKALYTVIDSKSITPEYSNGRNVIKESDFEVSCTAQSKEQFESFIKFEIKELKEIPIDWNYTDPSTFQNQLMAYILFEKGIKDIEKRKSKLIDLSLIFDSGEAKDVIQEALTNLGQKSSEPKIWFVTQGSTFLEDQGMKFLWAPKIGNDQKGRFYWKNVLKVKKGDFIFNYDGKLKGISIAKNDGYEASNSESNSSWGSDGYRVDIEIYILNPPLPRDVFVTNKSQFLDYLNNVTNKPFNSGGSINQGYLYEFSKEAGRFIRDMYGKKFGNNIIDEFFDKVILKENLITTEVMENNSIITAIKTKPFILLAGISGTGKSRLARTLAYKTCHKEELRKDARKPGNFEMIPVRSNWHDSSELMGYVSRINGEKYITTAFLRFIAKAWKNLDTPFFLCLDEMNLAPVEHYLAEYLSILETRQMDSGEVSTDFLISKSSFENQELYSQILMDLGLTEDPKFNNGIGIPSNLVIIGTVNMDETTHSFSRKVLDRAMTFEMNEVDLTAGLDTNMNDWEYPGVFINLNEVIGKFTAGREVVNLYPESKKVIEFLQNMNTALEGSPFMIAYRVRDEFLIYCYHANKTNKGSNWLDQALDDMTSMKILSRIEGDEDKTGDVLQNLQNLLGDNFKKSKLKLKEMERRLQNSGYTSFWT